MGAWGDGPFENDDACDWLFGLKKAKDTRLLGKTLDRARATKSCDAPGASMAIAAAEVVAALAGHPRSDLPGQVVTWLPGKLLAPGLIKAAKATVKRVRTDSELRDLWAEAEEDAEAGTDAWSLGLIELEARLSARGTKRVSSPRRRRSRRR